jgi:cytochrome P450
LGRHEIHRDPKASDFNFQEFKMVPSTTNLSAPSPSVQRSDGKERAPKPAHVPETLVRDIDMYELDGIEDGYHEAWKALQQSEGVHKLVWTPLTGGHWIAMDGPMVRDIYEDYQRFSSEVIFLPKEAGQKYAMVPTTMDPPEHTPYRQLLNTALSPSRIRDMEGFVRRASAEIIDGFVGRGHCDFSAEYGRVYPVKIFMTMCNLPLADVPMLSQFVDDMTRPPGNSPREQAAALEEANKGFFAYVERFVAERKGGDGNDLVSLFANSQIDGQPIQHDKALGLISLLLLGGLDTVLNFLSFMMLYLARHPDKVAEIRNDDLKLRRGVEELFRRFPIVAEARMVANDIVYHGVDLKRGDMVLIPTAMHSFDEKENPNPFELDWERKRLKHSTFGGGPHRCAGLHLARMEATVTLQEWLRRIPEFRLAEGSKPIFRSGTTATCQNVQLVWDLPS